MDIDWKGIIGHEENIARLRRMLREGRLPHALLFMGPEGVGKCRAARTLAAALLCGEPEGPCGKCPSCLALRQDSHPDYYEVRPESRGKGARAIRIEQIREMQAEASRLPILSHRRVVVIDEAELMNEAAENSLLKTLEEPTGQVTFLLVTGSRASLLDTIISRCMPVSFGMLPMDELAGLLACRGISTAEAEELAVLSDGSMGRALALHENDGMKLRDDAMAFLEGLGAMDMGKIWLRGKDMGEQGREKISEWLMYLNMLLRDMLVLYESDDSGIIYARDIQRKLADMLPEFPKGRIFQMLRLVKESQCRLQANVNLRLFMEGVLIRLKDI